MIVCSRCRRKISAIRYVARVRDQEKRSKNGRHSINMNTQMGSSLPSEKLDRSNYSSWEYNMNQFLVRQGHWSYNKAAKAQNRAKPRRNKATKSRDATKPRRGATQRSREESRATKTWRKPQAASTPTKPKEAKPDVGRLTLELEGACWDIKLN